MPLLEARPRITKVEQEVGSPWFRIGTEDPEIKGLSTQDQDRATEALGLKGERVLLKYDERIVNKNGRTYNNRYYQSATRAEPEAPAPQFDQVEPKRAGLPDKERWSISLGVGIKAAVATLPYFPDDQRTFELQKQVALGWARFHFFTPMPEREMAFAGGATTPGAYDDPGSELPPPADDDIPYKWIDYWATEEPWRAL